jgi:hypothetical protein
MISTCVDGSKSCAIGVNTTTLPLALMIKLRIRAILGAMRNNEADGGWEASFVSGRKWALRAVMQNETGALLSTVLDRLYVLRNQLIHGVAVGVVPPTGCR